MRRPVDDLRIRLIERLCRLPQPQLSEVEAFLGKLEADSATHHVGLPRMPLAAHKDWPHAPVHRLSEHGTFIVTGSTRHGAHLFRGEQRLTLLEGNLLFLAKQHDVTLEAWAVFSNHYHFIAHTTGVENQLAKMIAALHFESADAINRCDGSLNRPVWFNYWDTQLTFEKSYLARLNYVHHNAVKHGLVREARDYRWCSAAWFENTATRAQVKTIYGFKTERLKVTDDFEPLAVV